VSGEVLSVAGELAVQADNLSQVLNSRPI